MGIKHATPKVSGDKGYATEWNADHKIDDDVDFVQNEAQNLVIENRTTWPAGPVLGQIVYRTDVKQFFTWDGTSWIEYGEPTKEFYTPCALEQVVVPNCPIIYPPYIRAVRDTAGVDIGGRVPFYIPHDFTAVSSIVLVGEFSVTGNVTYDVCSAYGGVGEAYNNHNANIVGNIVAVTANRIVEVDITPALAAIAVGDFGVAQIEIQIPDPTTFYIWGIKFRYI